MAELHTDPNAVNIEVTESPLFHGKGLWHTAVARNAAYAADCKIYIKTRNADGSRKVVTLVGTMESIELASYLYQYLTKMLRHLSRVYCTEFYGHPNPGASVRSSFLEGCADSVGQRLRDKKDQVRAETRAAGTNCTALIVLDKEIAAVEEYMARLGLRAGRKRRCHGDATAYAHGHEAGKHVQLRDALKQGSSNGSPKMLR